MWLCRWAGSSTRCRPSIRTRLTKRSARAKSTAGPTQGRLPYNLAACDSSTYNYAPASSIRQTYFVGLDVEREDGNDFGARPVVFRVVRRSGSRLRMGPRRARARLGLAAAPRGRRRQRGKRPGHQIEERHAAAGRAAALAGEDFAEDLETMAKDYGVPVAKVKRCCGWRSSMKPTSSA